MSYLLEIATSDYASTALAVAAGADRIELCANLEEGGTTASYGILKKSREQFSLPIYPIIRPRGGDFLYSEEEFDCIMKDALLCRDLSFDGIVVGFLKTDGQINVELTSKIIEAVYPMQVTFHRAFDRCIDPFRALEELIEIGVERILTSGQRQLAPDGSDLIRKLQEQAANRIIIMPGSGVRIENIVNLANQTGCTEFHTSLRIKQPGEMKFVHPAFEGAAERYEQYSVNVEELRQIKAALLELETSGES